ncbi:MAG: gamma-glutamyl-gamma-aminobutyrate hydrolase family protein [Synergistaceae bacterium]|jgi:putative glutamine amidotransferase|nr:gamma-glutamyl-gamma-aminobutyrate hydrolase family protein [Synergistaceae bacterium]
MKILIAAEANTCKNYSDAMSGVGAESVVSLVETDFSDYDALLLPGGVDVDPSRFGQENRGSEEIDALLDKAQFAMLDAFVKAGKPVLGICRGLQVINVFFGGDLIQDLPNANEVHRSLDFDGDRVHLSSASSGTFLHKLYGAEFYVNSSHHQALGGMGKGMTAIQRAPDGVVECAAHNALPVVGVQWHPERMCFAHRRHDTVDGEILFRWVSDKFFKNRAIAG